MTPEKHSPALHAALAADVEDLTGRITELAGDRAREVLQGRLG